MLLKQGGTSYTHMRRRGGEKLARGAGWAAYRQRQAREKKKLRGGTHFATECTSAVGLVQIDRSTTPEKLSSSFDRIASHPFPSRSIAYQSNNLGAVTFGPSPPIPRPVRYNESSYPCCAASCMLNASTPPARNGRNGCSTCRREV